MAGSAVSAGLSGIRVGLLGGTGAQGRGLATRFARAGLDIVLGSRDGERARAVAAGLGAVTGGLVAGGPVAAGSVAGGSNAYAAEHSDVVVIAVPWSAHAATLSELAGQLAGKVVVDCVNPLARDQDGWYAVSVPEGSATQQAAALLPDSTVVGAFHHLSAVLLADPAQVAIDSDVLVVGDAPEATGLVRRLAETIPGVRALPAGRLRDAGYVEAITATLLRLGGRYRTHPGIKITELGEA
ncbi:MAG: NADPH-dependent F420 reductase [Nocardioides sp.]